MCNKVPRETERERENERKTVRGTRNFLGECGLGANSLAAVLLRRCTFVYANLRR